MKQLTDWNYHWTFGNIVLRLQHHVFVSDSLRNGAAKLHKYQNYWIKIPAKETTEAHQKLFDTEAVYCTSFHLQITKIHDLRRFYFLYQVACYKFFEL